MIEFSDPWKLIYLFVYVVLTVMSLAVLIISLIRRCSKNQWEKQLTNNVKNAKQWHAQYDKFILKRNNDDLVELNAKLQQDYNDSIERIEQLSTKVNYLTLANNCIKGDGEELRKELRSAHGTLEELFTENSVLRGKWLDAIKPTAKRLGMPIKAVPFPPTIEKIEEIENRIKQLTKPSAKAEERKAHVIMPESLTAENGAKYLLIGEFEEAVELECTACCEEDDEECDVCKGHGRYDQPVPVSWTTIKNIYREAVKHLGQPITTQQLPGEES